jgi:kynurenine formamidase
MHFPLWSLEAVKFLDMERDISGIGCDTLSPETKSGFPIHYYILGRGKYIVENLNNLD